MAVHLRLTPALWPLRCLQEPRRRATCYAPNLSRAPAIKPDKSGPATDRKWEHSTVRTHSHRSNSADYLRDADLPDFVRQLSGRQRKALLDELTKHEADWTASRGPASGSSVAPTARQLLYVAAVSGVPFIAFGLLDNTIMICAGEYIDITFGTMLGISTMAAAGLGNMCSDIVGISTANFVEHGLRQMGFKPPGLSAEMLQRRRVRWSANAGRIVGVSIGCLLGLFPLLLLESSDHEVQPHAAATQGGVS